MREKEFDMKNKGPSFVMLATVDKGAFKIKTRGTLNDWEVGRVLLGIEQFKSQLLKLHEKMGTVSCVTDKVIDFKDKEKKDGKKKESK